MDVKDSVGAEVDLTLSARRAPVSRRSPDETERALLVELLSRELALERMRVQVELEARGIPAAEQGVWRYDGHRNRQAQLAQLLELFLP